MSIYIQIQQSILDGEAEDTIRLIKQALALKYSPENILNEGLIQGIELVAEKFKTDTVLIPEALMSTRSVQAGLSTLRPYLKKDNKDKKQKVKVLMGVVSGDLHDIGKNIVKTLISTLDIDIIDLGINVSKDNFVKAIKEEKPDVLMISALLTTTMPEIKVVIDELKKKKLRKDLVIFVGGAPINEKFSKYVGADYYIQNVIELRSFLSDNLCKLINKKA